MTKTLKTDFPETFDYLKTIIYNQIKKNKKNELSVLPRSPGQQEIPKSSEFRMKLFGNIRKQLGNLNFVIFHVGKSLESWT